MAHAAGKTRAATYRHMSNGRTPVAWFMLQRASRVSSRRSATQLGGATRTGG